MNRNRLKFAGSLALGLSTAGVLLAAGGQLNFIGNERPASQPSVNVKKSNEEKPKYSFYDDLKKRKAGANDTNITTLNSQSEQRKPKVPKAQQSFEQQKIQSNQQQKLDDEYHYVVQVAAYAREADAKKFEAKVAALGYSTRIDKAKRYLVQVGPIIGKTKAYQIETQLKAKQFSTLVKRLK